MSALAVSAVIFLCVYGGALLGFWIRSLLPEHHLSAESKSVLQVGTGLIGTMAALVLGLLTASAKSSFDVQSDEVKQAAANMILLDRTLALYGSETQPLRAALRQAIELRVERWGRGSPVAVHRGELPAAEQMARQVHALEPGTDDQRADQARALELLAAIGNMRWLAIEQSSSSISWPFLIVVVSWLTVIFTSFGLMAEPNATIAVTLAICALSVATAIFLILELDQPFSGLVHISAEPFRLALEQMGK